MIIFNRFNQFLLLIILLQLGITRPPEKPIPFDGPLLLEEGNSNSNEDIRVSDDRRSGENSEVTIVASKNGPLLIGWVDFRWGTRCCFSTSQDMGLTWDAEVCAQPMQNGFTGDPTMGVDDEGNFYAVCQDYSNSQIRMSHSLDGGKNWSSWRSVQNAIDKPWVKATRNGTVFLTWLGRPGGFRRSLDHGVTWDDVISLGNLNHGTAIANGNTGLVHIHYNQGSYLRYVRSEDWGATLDNGRNLSHMGSSCYGCSPRQHPVVGSASDPTGQVVAATWSARITGGDGDDDVWVVISRDGGDTWTDAIRANDNTQRSRQFQPWVAVDPNGRVHVVWTDTRHNGTNAIYYTSTTTDVFEPNEEITDQRGPLMGFYGDYKGITIQGDDVLVAWSDTRNNENQIFFSRGIDLAKGPFSPILPKRKNKILKSRWSTINVFDVQGKKRGDKLKGSKLNLPKSKGKYIQKPK